MQLGIPIYERPPHASGNGQALAVHEALLSIDFLPSRGTGCTIIFIRAGRAHASSITERPLS
jgi:hypothetical protein